MKRVPLHLLSDKGVFNTGEGFIVIVNVAGVPEQPFAVGVTVIWAKIGATVLLVAVKDGMLFPVPLAAKPIAILLLVQLKVVKGTGPDSRIAGVAMPLQNGLSDRGLTVGEEKLVMVPETED